MHLYVIVDSEENQVSSTTCVCVCVDTLACVHVCLCDFVIFFFFRVEMLFSEQEELLMLSRNVIW